MQVVLDTNVIISSVFFGGVPRELVDRAIGGEFETLTSPAMLGELERVLLERFDFSPVRAAAVRSEVEAMSLVVEVTEIPEIPSDLGDNEVLAAATAGSADLIVTGDRDLLDLIGYQGVPVETPRAFLDQLSKES